MAFCANDYNALKRFVRDGIDYVWKLNHVYHGQQNRGDNDFVRVLGGLKILQLAILCTILPEAFDVRRPTDYHCDTYWSIVFLEDGRRFHVPRLKWAEAKSNTLVKTWFTL